MSFTSTANPYDEGIDEPFWPGRRSADQDPGSTFRDADREAMQKAARPLGIDADQAAGTCNPANPRIVGMEV